MTEASPISENGTRYDYVCWLVQSKLNGIKYFPAGYLPALFSMLHHVFKIDPTDVEELKVALASTKEALRIYFGIYQKVHLAESFQEEWFCNLTFDDFEIKVWKNDTDIVFKEGRGKGGLLFHYAVYDGSEDFDE